MNYALDHDTVLIHISPHSTLATHLRSARASFEIDDFDDYNQSGWSVLVRGNAAYVETADLPDDDRPSPGQRASARFHVRITPHDISGRRLLSA